MSREWSSGRGGSRADPGDEALLTLLSFSVGTFMSVGRSKILEGGGVAIELGSSASRRASGITGGVSGAGGDELWLASIDRLSIVGGREVGTETGSRFPTEKVICCRSACRYKGK
jgi:hypothetical protein